MDSRSQGKFPTDQTTFLGTIETDSNTTHNQDAPITVDPGSHTLRLLDRLRHRGKLSRNFQFRGLKNDDPSSWEWRRAIVLATVVTAIILVINIIFTIIAARRFPADRNGVGLIYSGNCDRVKRWDMALHLLINLLGIVLLAATSFTMQCLSSPTRDDVDAAHAAHASLQIGINSFANLFSVRRWKAVVWLLLCLSTVPLHLLWNSTIFTTLSQNRFSVVVANEAFLQGAGYSQVNDSSTLGCNAISSTPTAVVGAIYDGYKSGKYSSMTAAECFDAYTGDMDGSRRNLIILVQQPVPSNRMIGCGFDRYHWSRNAPVDLYANTSIYYDSSLLVYYDTVVTWNGSSVVGLTTDVWTSKVLKEEGWTSPYNWLRSLGAGFAPLDYFESEIKSTGTWPLSDYRVTACQSEDAVSTPCDLQLFPTILFVVVACNVVKFACMCITAYFLWHQEEHNILATVGDAVSSYLERPDDTTRGLCLVDHRDRTRGIWPPSALVYNRRPKRRLYFATTDFRWWSSVTICTGYLVIGWILFHVMATDWVQMSFKESLHLKFGTFDHTTANVMAQFENRPIVLSLVSNVPQLALSTTYFLYNSLYTAQCGALEWVSYIQSRKALRVTYPRGKQRSSYYLQLPYRYGIPLFLALALLHVLISQSVFLGRLQYYNWTGDRVSTDTALGYSLRAMFASCLVGTVLILAQIAHACRPLDNRIPTHGNDSAIISAMCHPSDESELEPHDLPSNMAARSDIATGLIMWGVTLYPDGFVDGSSMGLDSGRDGAGHCGFSADIVELPEVGKKYR